MLSKKYSEEFLKIYDEVNNKRQVINKIIETEKETEIALLDWEDKEIATFLRGTGGVSPQSLNKSVVILRKFANFICTKEKIEKREYNMEDGVFMQLIDRKHLQSVTISYEEYMTIKEQLDVTGDGEEKINLRDKVIFELAWAGLTNDEIRLIKNENIEFVHTENDWDITILTLEDKVIRIEDPSVTEDIKLCMKELYCIRTAKDSRTKKTFYKDSEYLVKPINVGRTSSKTYLDNPHLALQRVLRTGEIVCKGIDVENLTLTDIRRSKLIYLLAPENSEFFDYKTVAAIYNFKRLDSIRWFKEIATEKYGK